MTSFCSINRGTICFKRKQTHSLSTLYILNLLVRPTKDSFQHSYTHKLFEGRFSYIKLIYLMHLLPPGKILGKSPTGLPPWKNPSDAHAGVVTIDEVLHTQQSSDIR